MRVTAGVLALVAVALVAASGLCAPGSGCVQSLAHALFVTPAASTLGVAPVAAHALRPALASLYESVVADPISPPPRA